MTVSPTSVFSAAAELAGRASAAGAAATHESHDVIALARSLADAPTASWTATEWQTLDAVLGALEHTGGDPRLPTALPGVRSLGRIAPRAARGDAGQLEGITRYMDAWRPALAARDVEALAIPSGDPGTWSPEQWKSLRSLVDDARTSGLEHVDPKLVRHGRAAIDRAVRGTPEDEAIRLAAALQVANDPTFASAAARRDAVLDLLAREPEALTPADWRRITAMVDVDVDRAVRGPVREVDDLPDLGDLATRHARGVRTNASTDRAIAAWQLVVDGTADDVERMRSTLRAAIDGARTERRPEHLRTLAALLDVDAASLRLEGPRHLPGTDDLGTVLRQHLRTGARTPSLERYLSAWVTGLDGRWSDASTLRAAAYDLVQRDAAAFTRDDWRLLAELADADAAGGVLRVPVTIDDGEAIAEVAMRAATGAAVPTTTVQRMLDAWRIGLAPGSTTQSLRTEFAALLDAASRDSGSLDRADWRRLASLLRLGPTRLGVPEPSVQAPDLIREIDVLASAVGRGSSHATQRSLDAWAMQLRFASGSTAPVPLLREVLAASPAGLDREGWTTVRAVLDALPAAPGEALPIDPKRLDSLRYAADRGAHDPGSAQSTYAVLLDDVVHDLDPSWISERRVAAWAALDGGRLDSRFDLRELADIDPYRSMRSPFERLAIDAAAGAFPANNLKSARDLVTRVLEIPHAPANMPDSLVPAWRDARRLAQVNLERLNGHTPRGEIRGYSNHPDYAQLGRLKANIDMIRRLTPSDNPIGYRAMPADAASSAAAGTADELLTW